MSIVLKNKFYSVFLTGTLRSYSVIVLMLINNHLF